MSKLLTIQDHDRQRIEYLMEELQIKKQIDVLRAGLDLLEMEALRLKRIKRWEKSAKAVAKDSLSINREFQKKSRFKQI